MPQRLPHAQAPHEHRTHDEDTPVYTTRRTRSALELRPSARVAALPRATAWSTLLGDGLGWRKPKITQITTAPGQLGAGETETEADEPPTRLPTTRAMPLSEPLVPPSVVTLVLFESSRLLSVVPATLGVFVNAWCLWCPPGHAPAYRPPDHYDSRAERTGWGRPCPPDRADYFVAVLWAILTAHQCLRLTTGLLHRWRAYYSPLSTLIRLLALQAICWPATHFTLGIVGNLGTNAPFSDGNITVLDGALLRWTTARPDICWAVIGTTTCVSRSIQIWVTSNLLVSTSSGSPSAVPDRLRPRRAPTGDETRKLTGRRWDWGIVARLCMLPAACLYFVMTWVGAWRREEGGC